MTHSITQYADLKTIVKATDTDYTYYRDHLAIQWLRADGTVWKNYDNNRRYNYITAIKRDTAAVDGDTRWISDRHYRNSWRALNEHCSDLTQRYRHNLAQITLDSRDELKLRPHEIAYYNNLVTRTRITASATQTMLRRFNKPYEVWAQLQSKEHTIDLGKIADGTYDSATTSPHIVKAVKLTVGDI